MPNMPLTGGTEADLSALRRFRGGFLSGRVVSKATRGKQDGNDKWKNESVEHSHSKWQKLSLMLYIHTCAYI